MPGAQLLPDGVRFALLAPLPPPAGPGVAGPRSGLRPGLFLDRDGVLVEEVEHLHRTRDLRLLPGAAEIAAAANAAGVAAVTVSNQSGIARGMYGWDAYEAVEAEIDRRLGQTGARLDARVACGTHPDFTPNWSAAHAHWRKPGPGMLVFAAERLGLDLARSWMVGDMATDAAAAKAAGLKGCIHVATGHGADHFEAALSEATQGFTVLPAADLIEARDLLTGQGLLR